MELELWARTYDCFGGLPSAAAFSHWLLEGAGEFGPAIRAVEITFCFPHPGPPRKTLEELFTRYHQYRCTLPRVVFRRSRERVTIEVASDVLNGRGHLHRTPLTLEQFQCLAVELVAALGLLRQRVKPKDEFRLEAFVAHCDEALQRLPRTSEQLQRLQESAEVARAAHLESLSAWEKLGIDFRDFHPAARALLDDPWFWDCADDFAPHGNDTGADLLEDYAGWLRRCPQGDPLKFLAHLFKRWGFTPEADREVADEAAVALAFAELKHRGACRPAAADLALQALERQRRTAEAATGWAHRAERLRAVERLSAKLRGSPKG